MKKIFILIIIVFVLISSSTLAFFIWNNNFNQDIEVGFNLNGLDAYINYNKGTDVLTGTLLPSKDYSGGISTEIELWKSPSAASRNIYGHIYLDITTIGANLTNEEALKWVITSNGEVLNEGNFVGQTEESYVILDTNIPLSTTKQLFQVYIWLDESMEINEGIEGEMLSTKIRAEATEVIYPEIGVKYVSSLMYYDNEMINNDDPDGNIRYMGKDPNNYVLFNNELWRIIGVFNVKSSVDGPYEKKMKIIRDESLGRIPWDTNNTNDWSTASLQTYLNEEYYNGLNIEAKKIIEEVYWNLGGTSIKNYEWNCLTKDFYYYERDEKVYTERPTYWIGKIGLMYPSDYGYSTSGGNITDRSSCLAKALCNWDDDIYSDCKNNNYLFGAQVKFLLSSNSVYVFYIHTTGSVYDSYPFTNYEVLPTVYLKSSVEIVAGTGTSTNPYILSIK